MTERQQLLLEAIIREFIDTSEAVGSVSIVDKYDLDISPATVRSEMANLVRQGFLYQFHASGGRVPTTLGWKYYIEELLDEENLSPEEEVVLKEHLFQNRFKKDVLIREAIEGLNRICGVPALALVDQNVYFSGISDIIKHREFQSLENLQQILLLLENPSLLRRVFDKYKRRSDVKVLIGEEMGMANLHETGVVFADFTIYKNKKGTIAVLGPSRMSYSRVIPAVYYVSKQLTTVVSGW